MVGAKLISDSSEVEKLTIYTAKSASFLVYLVLSLVIQQIVPQIVYMLIRKACAITELNFDKQS